MYFKCAQKKKQEKNSEASYESLFFVFFFFFIIKFHWIMFKLILIQLSLLSYQK